MKKALAGVLAASFVGLMAAGAMAQVPNLQVYFDANYTQTQANCGVAGTVQDMYVVMNNWNMYVLGVDFSIDYPASALFISGETLPAGSISLGGSNSDSGSGAGSGGIAIAWGLPQNGYSPVLALTVSGIWLGTCDCGNGPQALVVRGTHYAQPPSNGGKTAPSAIRWPDYVELAGVGMTSLICPGPVAVKEQTWGGVKALYR
jgi:hypothetical protein